MTYEVVVDIYGSVSDNFTISQRKQNTLLFGSFREEEDPFIDNGSLEKKKIAPLITHYFREDDNPCIVNRSFGEEEDPCIDSS
mmetsp:Transcript_35353/g.39714  ORF Transcript_35353/g.39714 Transcript_35353/m.39714 type:complete len:83 (-) Transcript_35353:52-300(-)